MKSLAIFVVLGAISMSVLAQESKPAVVNISGADQGVQNVRAMDASEFAPFQRTYELSNGDSVTLFSRNGQKYAKLGQGEWQAIAATGSNSFVSRNNNLKMQIILNSDGSVGGEVFLRSHPPMIGQAGVQDNGYTEVAFR